MIMLSEESMSKTKLDWKLGLLHQTIGQIVDAEEKFLNKIKNTTPVNT